MYVLSELPSDLNKQGPPMIPPPPWFGPGITWDLPVKAVKPSGLGSRTPPCPPEGCTKLRIPVVDQRREQERVSIEKARAKARHYRNYQKIKKFLPAILVAAALAWYLSKRRS